MRASSELLCLAGRRVMITGAASGIGRAIALRFAEAGADLVLVDMNTSALKDVADELKDGPHKVTTRIVDLSERS